MNNPFFFLLSSLFLPLLFFPPCSSLLSFPPCPSSLLLRGVGGSAASGAGAGGAGIVSAARAEELAVEARRAEDAVKAARLKKKDAEECLKKLHSRSKQLQVCVCVCFHSVHDRANRLVTDKKYTSVGLYLYCCGPSCFFVFLWQTLIPKLEMRLQGVGASEEQYREQMEALQVGFWLLFSSVVAVACYEDDLAFEFFFFLDIDAMEFLPAATRKMQEPHLLIFLFLSLLHVPAGSFSSPSGNAWYIELSYDMPDTICCLFQGAGFFSVLAPPAPPFSSLLNLKRPGPVQAHPRG